MLKISIRNADNYCSNIICHDTQFRLNMDELLKILISILLWNLHQGTVNYTAPGKIVALVFFSLGLVRLFVCLFPSFKEIVMFQLCMYFQKQCYLSWKDHLCWYAEKYSFAFFWYIKTFLIPIILNQFFVFHLAVLGSGLLYFIKLAY